MKRLAIVVSGKVQGVFYRASAKDQAESIGIKGFVRNEPNGDVYMEAEGDEQQLNTFLEWCRQGPPRAEVQQLSCKEHEPVGFGSFDVKR
jgi:acylphosphatase